MRHALAHRRLAWTLVFLTWFAQLCMPVAHAVAMGSPAGAMSAWCGDPAGAREAAALLPAEIREALDPDATSAEHLASCAKLCAAMAKTPPLPTIATAQWLSAVDTVPVLTRAPVTMVRRHALPPPSHAPPAGA